MEEKWQAKLKRLGVTKGARDLKLPENEAGTTRPTAGDGGAARFQRSDDAEWDEAVPLDRLLPGLHLQTNSLGECQVQERVYPVSYRHGGHTLAELADYSHQAAGFHLDGLAADRPFRDYLFLDTETTGLAGANVVAFLVGVAYYDGDAFVVRQYFMRDFEDEAAMLELLAALLADKAGLITFNGRSFDVPLLESRYMMNRLDVHMGKLSAKPHLDLLHPARRMWRARLGSCALTSLEDSLLAIERTEEDVPGWLIPRLYEDYLRSGDGRELARVFYHNEIDLLSMASLGARLLRQFDQPGQDDPTQDLVSLGRWQAHLQQHKAAEASFRLALQANDSSLADFQQAAANLAMLLKRQERRDEAADLWRQIAVTSIDDVEAHVELAKHYEWHANDLDAARRWTAAALALVNRWGTARRQLAEPELQHRLERLERKLAGWDVSE